MNIQFSVYGALIGVGLVIALELITRKARDVSISEQYIFSQTWLVFVFAVLGARIWHVATDWSLYADNIIAVLQIWNGGLSIFGGLLGGVLGVYLANLLYSDQAENSRFFKILDLLPYGIPVAQIFGRLGNFYNQELYGLPTDSFLGIAIRPENRIAGYESFERFHPLFLYEIVFLLIFLAILYMLEQQNKVSHFLGRVGSGQIFGIYILYYSLVRFCLDFIRLDKAESINGLGINQLILIGVIVLLSVFLYNKKRV